MTDSGLHAQLACVWEATARKPGNVHRFADFTDVHYLDFLASAAAIGPVLDAGPGRPLGGTILRAVEATRRVARSNTNLGMVLLLAPLAAVPDGEPLDAGVARLLAATTVEDSRLVYRAIRLANPGGLGQSDEQDLSGEPTLPLREVMALARDRDGVARQYADGYADVFGEGIGSLQEGLEKGGALETAIIFCHVHLMAARPDTLIARKRGLDVARESARRAGAARHAFWAGRKERAAALAELDAWLREDGHARNPGTTADLVAACLYAALARRIIELPPQVPWSDG